MRVIRDSINIAGWTLIVGELADVGVCTFELEDWLDSGITKD